MKLFTAFILMFTLFSSAQTNKEVPDFSIAGLLPYQGMSMTTYLVSAGNSFIGTTKQINRVFQVLDNRIIVESEVSFKPEVKTRSSFGIKPNSIVVVIHPERSHALNKFNTTPNTGVRFSEPVYSNASDKVAPTEENKKFIKKEIILLEDLNREGIIKF